MGGRCARAGPLASIAKRNSAPPPRRVRRHRRAQLRRARLPADREREVPRSKVPPRPDGRSPAWRRGRSRCPRRPSAHRRARQGARHRRGMGRASSSPDRPALCLLRHGQGKCGGSRAAFRPRRASPARPSPARCRPRGASDPHGSGASAPAGDAGRARRDRSRPAVSSAGVAACQIVSAASVRLVSSLIRLGGGQLVAVSDSSADRSEVHRPRDRRLR